MAAVMEQQPATPVQQFRAELNRMQGQIKAALPPHVGVDRFIRTVVTAVQTNPGLLTVDRGSLLIACIESATDGLLPDGREGAIVPYKGRANWQPMVWGLVKLVRQSGELATIGARVVRDGEEFSHWIDEDGEHFKHVPAYSSDTNDLSAMRLVYAYAKTKDGSLYFEAMGSAEIEKFRQLSKASSADSPWKTWPEEMAKVRPLKRLCKRLPLSTDALEALERDAAREAAMTGLAPKANPITEINQSIVGAAPALTNEPSPVLDGGNIIPAKMPAERAPAAPAETVVVEPAEAPKVDTEALRLKIADFRAAVEAAETTDEIADLMTRCAALSGALELDEYKSLAEFASGRIKALAKAAKGK